MYEPVIGLEEGLREEFPARTWKPGHGFWQAGACQRRLWAEHHDMPVDDRAPDTAGSLLSRSDGTLHEKDIIRRIRDRGFTVWDCIPGTEDDERPKQFGVTASEPEFAGSARGRLDMIVEMDFNDNVIGEAKSMAPSRFARIVNQGVQQGHTDAYCQGTLYVRYSDQLPIQVSKEHFLYVAKPRSGLREAAYAGEDGVEVELPATAFYEELVPYDEVASEKIAEFEIDKANFIRESIAPAGRYLDGDLNVAYHDRENDWPCKEGFCAYRTWCLKLPVDSDVDADDRRRFEEAPSKEAEASTDSPPATPEGEPKKRAGKGVRGTAPSAEGSDPAVGDGVQVPGEPEVPV